MIRIVIVAFCLLCISCKNKNTFVLQKSNNSNVLDIDSVFSDQIQVALRGMIYMDKNNPTEKRIYTAHLKIYFNTTTVFFRREYRIDSLRDKFADTFCFLDSNLIIVFNGMNDIKGSLNNININSELREIGFSTEWGGMVRDNPGFMFYIYKGGIDKIDSSLSTDFNLNNHEIRSINFIKPK